MKEGRWGPATALAHSACLTNERRLFSRCVAANSRPGWGQQIPSPILASWLLFGSCQWEALAELTGQEGARAFPRAAGCGQGPEESTVHSEAAAAAFP